MKYQQIPGRNSKRKLQKKSNWKYSIKTRVYQSIA
jgi:hypothetical protein